MFACSYAERLRIRSQVKVNVPHTGMPSVHNGRTGGKYVPQASTWLVRVNVTKTTVGLFSCTCQRINIKKRWSMIFTPSTSSVIQATAKFNPDVHFFWSNHA
jgi:hypothetical protein